MPAVETDPVESPAKRQRTRALTSPSRVLGNVFNDAPMLDAHTVLKTKGGLTVYRNVEETDGLSQLEAFTDLLDGRRGAIFKSSYEYPGRYNRWSMGFVNPPIELTCNAKTFTLTALNARGDVLLPPMVAALSGAPAVASISTAGRVATGSIAAAAGTFTEEDRSRQPSIFSIIRVIVDLFFTSADTNLGLYGAFGYDLAFQVRRRCTDLAPSPHRHPTARARRGAAWPGPHREPADMRFGLAMGFGLAAAQFEHVPLERARAADHRDLVLWLPDQLVCIDEHSNRSFMFSYDFEVAGGKSTKGLSREENPEAPFVMLPGATKPCTPVSDHKVPALKDRSPTAAPCRPNLFQSIGSNRSAADACPRYALRVDALGAGGRVRRPRPQGQGAVQVRQPL